MKCTVDHVGIAVPALSEVLVFYRDVLGLEIDAPEEVASQRVRVQFARPGRLRARAEFRLREILTRRFLRHVEQQVLGDGGFDRLLDRMAAREIDPYSAADQIFARGASLPLPSTHHAASDLP